MMLTIVRVREYSQWYPCTSNSNVYNEWLLPSPFSLDLVSFICSLQRPLMRLLWSSAPPPNGNASVLSSNTHNVSSSTSLEKLESSIASSPQNTADSSCPVHVIIHQPPVRWMSEFPIRAGLLRLPIQTCSITTVQRGVTLISCLHCPRETFLFLSALTPSLPASLLGWQWQTVVTHLDSRNVYKHAHCGEECVCTQLPGTSVVLISHCITWHLSKDNKVCIYPHSNRCVPLHYGFIGACPLFHQHMLYWPL